MSKKCVFCEFMKGVLLKLWKFTYKALGVLLFASIIMLVLFGIFVGLGYLFIEVCLWDTSEELTLDTYSPYGFITLYLGIAIYCVVWLPFKIINETRKAIIEAYRNAKRKCN